MIGIGRPTPGRAEALRWWLALLAAALLYAAAVFYLQGQSRMIVREEMRVVLPRLAQVFLAGGDRYLAANIGMFRAMVAATDRMQREHFAAQAKVQVDVAWFNPAHEDNYYVAAAILPWVGEIDPAQQVLLRASRSRPFDWQPDFYHAFNLYHFQRQPVRAAELLLAAAPKARSENDRYTMENIAAMWFEKGYDAATAVRVVEEMAKGARSRGFRRYLEARSERLRVLVELEQSAARFRQANGRAPANMAELLAVYGKTPVDPFGFGYELDQQGMPRLRNSPPQKSER